MANQIYKVTLPNSMGALDASNKSNPHTNIPHGTHQMELIANPYQPGSDEWLVLVGTQIGSRRSDYYARMISEVEGFKIYIEPPLPPMT